MLENYTEAMLKKITFLNIVLGLSSTILAYLVFPKYAGVLLLGIVVASINFILNGIITSRLVSLKGNKMFIVISFLLRTFLVSVLGLLVYKADKFNIISYMLGYSIQFISIILYGLSIKDE